MLRKSKSAKEFIDRYNDLQDQIDDFETLDESDFETTEEFEDACVEQADVEAEFASISDAHFLSEDDFLIHEDEFEEYVVDMVEDIYGKIPDFIVVDWESTADNVRSDYSVVELEGESYFYRS